MRPAQNMPMRLVVDTNVVVSGIINGDGAPGKIVDAILRGEITVIFSSPILAEYQEVLRRSKFAFDLEKILDFIEAVEGGGEYMLPIASTFTLPDEKDRPFIDVARTAGCPVVTGNIRDFPPATDVKILSPTQALALL